MANFNKSPYYDDYDENKKFLRILFQPGRPVQARELTQLQSILQTQIERGGAHIFRSGSKVFDVGVSGGEENFDPMSVRYVKLNRNDKFGNIVDVSNFIGKQIRTENFSESSSIGTVVSGSANAGGDPTTLFVKWDEGEPEGLIQDNLVLRTWDPDGTGSYYTANVAPESDVSGPCSVYETNDGVYFVNGKYVKADAQTLVLGKYTSNVTYRIGFDVIEETVTSATDSSLLDPSAGFSNYTGSGADRYKINLVLTKKGDGTTISEVQASSTISTEIGQLVSTNNFFEIARVDDGRLVRQVKTPFYAELENTLARKLYDQSGNFTVDPHIGTIKEKTPAGDAGLAGSDEYILTIEGGKSYVHGFEYNNIGQSLKVSIPKARETEVVEQRVPIIYNNYVMVHDIQNTSPLTSSGVGTGGLPAKGFFDVVAQPLVSLFSQDSYITNSLFGANNNIDTFQGVSKAANLYNSIFVGTARAEALIYDSGATTSARNHQWDQGRSYRLYLTDFRPNYVDGAANGVNRADIDAVWYDTAESLTYYKFKSLVQNEHGFSNSSDTSTGIEDFSSGADHVSIQGFTVDGGYWNIEKGKVEAANSTWIGVRSLTNSTNNFYARSSPPASNGFISRTTRNGISSRRMILLDERTRALWSDAYNGATITITGGPGEGDRRTIVDYIGGSTANQVYDLQAAGDETFIPTNNLDGIAKRGLAIVDREFSAPPTRETTYRIDFSMKNARSVGINANTNANGYATSDYKYYRQREQDTNMAAGTLTPFTKGATPNFTTLWNIDAVSGVEPKGSLGAFTRDGIYLGTRIDGDTIYKGPQAGTLLGATGRAGVQSLNAHGSGTATSSNTHFTAQRTFKNQTFAGVGTGNKLSIAIGQVLYDHGQRFFPYDGASNVLEEDELNRFVHVVEQTTGRVVDFSKGDGDGKVDIKYVAATGHSAHTLDVTLPTGDGFGAGDYDVIATMLHENIAPKKKTLIKANTVDLAPGLLTTGHNLSNGQIIIKNNSGNNALIEKPFGQTDDQAPPSYVFQSLGIADVHSVKILDTWAEGNPTSDMIKALANNNAEALTATGANNITTNFIFDSGQRDHIYDHASLKLKPDAPVPNGQCLVLFDYWDHQTSEIGAGSVAGLPSYFSVDSYQHTEDLTITDVTGTFSVGDIIKGNTTGVSAKVFDVPDSSTKIRVVNLDPFEGNTHFTSEDFIHKVSGVASSDEAKVTAVANLQIRYENIPSFVGTSRVYSLTDVIDYRPAKNRADVFRANSTVNNVVIPVDASAYPLGQYQDLMPNYKFKAYMGRIDKVYLTPGRAIEVANGVPSSYPGPPHVPESQGMVLFEVFLPPYGRRDRQYDKGIPLLNTVTNRRYTVKDIARIDNRVRNLEYYVALNALERAAKDDVVTDSQGMTRFKNGILTDNFNAFNTVKRQVDETVNIVNGVKEPTYSLDIKEGHLRPATTVNSTSWSFQYSDGSSSETTASGTADDAITINYNSVVWSDPDAPYQLSASESSEFIQEEDGSTVLDGTGTGSGKVNINPFNVMSYQGFMEINPNFDNFIDTIDSGEVRFVDLTTGQNALEHIGITEDDVRSSDFVGGTYEETSQITNQEIFGSWTNTDGTPEFTAETEYDIDMAAMGARITQSGTQGAWGDLSDHYHVTFTEPQKFTVELGETYFRSFAKIPNIPKVTIQKTENSIVDIRIATYMRSRDISVVARGLKPRTPVYGHFDGLNVSGYMSSASMVRFEGSGRGADAISLGKRTGTRSGQRIHEWVSIDVEPNAKAKLIGVRGNTAFLTEITYGTATPNKKFSDSGITLVGNTTGPCNKKTNQNDIGVSQNMMFDPSLPDDVQYRPITPNPGYEHRSGYARPLVADGDNRNPTTWITLDHDAPSRSNALALHFADPSTGDPVELTDTESLTTFGNMMTSISIVKGKNAGAHGTIVEYDGATRSARVEWGTSMTSNGPGAAIVGTLGADDRDYYTLAGPWSPVSYGPGSLYTSPYGEYYGTFHLPKTDTAKFTVGTKALTINDRGDNNPFLVSCRASAPYFSSGSIHSLVDEAFATRDVIQGEIVNDTQKGVKIATDGSNQLWATRQTDGQRGILWVTTGIDVLQTGGVNYPYVTYDRKTSSKYLRGEMVGAYYNSTTKQWTYSPKPTQLPDGSGSLGSITWDEFYDAQYGTAAGFSTGEISNMKSRKIGQRHSLVRAGDDGGTGNGRQDYWRFHDQHSRFPSIVPSGGTIAASRGFATVKDGEIIAATVTDHGACIQNEGVEPKPSKWTALWTGNQPYGKAVSGGLEGTRSSHQFVGESRMSSDINDIRNALPYVDEILTDIENGTPGTIPFNFLTDPLAQSFTVSKEKYTHGIFLTGVDLWFAEKGSSAAADVFVEMRKMVNGYPDQGPMNCVGGADQAIAKVDWDDINHKNGVVEGAGATGLPNASDADMNTEGSSVTTFMFPAPVYLLPGHDYCFVVRPMPAVNKSIYLWSSDLRGNILGSYESNAPTSIDLHKAGKHFNGSLFLSQNARTWEPDQYKDLMFRLRRAEFTQSQGEAVLRAGTKRWAILRDADGKRISGQQEIPLTANVDFDFFHFTSESVLPFGYDKQSGGITYQYTAPDTDDVTSGYTTILPKTDIYPDRTLRLEKNKEHDLGSFEVKVLLRSPGDTKVSPVLDRSTMQLIALKNNITDGRIQNEQIVFSGSGGQGYTVGDRFKLVPSNSDHANSDIGYVEVSEVNAEASDAITKLVVSSDYPGRNYSETPTVVQHTSGGTLLPDNAIIIQGETGAIGGNSKFRYVTKPVKLRSGFDAMDLEVKMDIHKPFGSKVHVYYKVLHKDDADPLGFDNKKWVKMEQDSPNNERHTISKNDWSSKNRLDMMEHTFGTGDNDMISYKDSRGHNYDGFKYFAIKIVGFADNATQVPVIGNLRVVAVT